ncbi:sugar transferase [uncultured Clostridium sp.]|uniref:sugar transferase n=1 Tax=uncultured Clostridium sp. TaxID=59620 RepID=UPI0025DA899D|nr:sugar transferase [uncultured Clostridium sp.]
MKLIKWDELPDNMKNNEVRYYYEILSKKKTHLLYKRIFDLIVALILLIVLSPIMLVVSLAIKLTDRGPVFYRQVRVTQYGKEFKIFKFRTMVMNADKIGTQVTVGDDPRITKVGKKIRKLRLDEIPQLLNVICGDMSFVGTRPEVVKYVEKYTNEMLATLLLPAGITSKASIKFKDEDKILEIANNVDKTYIEEVLPKKMYFNLNSIKEFTFHGEIKVMVETVLAVFSKDKYSESVEEIISNEVNK